MSAGCVLGGGFMASRGMEAVEDVEGTVALVNGCAEDDGRVWDFEEDCRTRACVCVCVVAGVARQNAVWQLRPSLIARVCIVAMS